MNQPARTFALAATVVLILLLMYQLPTISISGIELRHVNILSDILPEPVDSADDVIPLPAVPRSAVAEKGEDTSVVVPENWSKGVEPILDYSEGRAGGMDHFFAALSHSLHSERPVRIAYYGDSFIEGDIFTGDLREMLQEKFGGNGVGWVDCGSSIIRYRRSINQVYSGITEYAVVNKPFDRRLQGISERYFIPAEGAFVKTSASRFHAHARQWSKASLFFRTASSLDISAKTSSGSLKTESFTASRRVQMMQVEDSMNTISYRFSHVGTDTQLYGMALESEKGVILDNFSMRGSSGILLANIPLQTLEDFQRHRPYDLIIFQFGLNTATVGNKTGNLRAYVRQMKKVINHFRAAFPEASILIMSVPDREQRSAAGIQTLRQVKELVALQRRLAADCNVGFYNFYQAMGGESSMKSLVQRKMANKDYTHLSFGGGKFIARKVFPSFVEGLENYRRRAKTKQ